MMRTHHTNNVKREGECVYVRESLPVRNFGNSYICKCLTLEVPIGDKKRLRYYFI